MRAQGLFVTGTDTGVGKTVLSAAIVAARRAQGIRVRAVKPILTGLEERSDPDWPHDHEALARAAGCSPDQVAIRRYDPPVSPHLAAELSGRAVDPAALADEVLATGAGYDELIVEGVGGLLVPLGPDWDVRRFAQELAFPIVVAARAGLGTINHTLLTLEAARAAGLTVAAVVLTPWPHEPSEIEASNRETIAERGGVEVATLGPVRRAEPDLLARAGACLPVDAWLGAALPSVR